MAQKTIFFDVESLLRLLTHYSDGRLPLDAEIQAAANSQYLPGWIGLWTKSKEWTEKDIEQPLHLRYEGRKVMIWDEKGTNPRWQEGNETPKRV